MKLVKSLLLGSAAGMAAVAGAHAADLPFRKAAPVDYVRVCDWVGGGGYFYIPGTDTCVKLGGLARAEFGYVEPDRYFTPNSFGTLAGIAANGGANIASGNYVNGRQRNSTGLFARGALQVDARTQTAYGLLRANARVQADRATGNYNGAFSGASTNGSSPFGGSGGSAYLDRGYITFAGFTAGRVQSFFDFYADTWNYDGIANSDSSTTAFAYTATFGGGFSATVAVEDGVYRRSLAFNGIGSIAFGNTAIGAAANVLPAGAFANGLAATYGGERIPDAVAQIRYDQAWGAIQLSAAYHDVNTITASGTPGVLGAAAFQSATESGFAVQGGIDVKLPMIAAGDRLFLQGAYQEGAFSYQDEAGFLNGGYYGIIVGGLVHPTVDAVAVGNGPGSNGYHLELGKGFSVLGAFHHYFTPQFHDILYGSYEELSYGSQVRNISWQRGGIGDASEFRVGNQFVFTPVNNLDIGVDVMYSKLYQDLGTEAGVSQATERARFRSLVPGVAIDPDSFVARLRFNRDF